MLVFMKLFLLFILVLCIVISNILNKLSDGVEINVDKFCVLWLWIWFYFVFNVFENIILFCFWDISNMYWIIGFWKFLFG